jgi:DNA-directed RNA polymerase specialized sigma24 family protein
MNSDLRKCIAIAEAMNDTIKADTHAPHYSIQTLERLTDIRTWGRIAAEGSRLGYGKMSLDGSGSGDAAMSVERFEQISNVVQTLPLNYRTAVISIYQNGKNITRIAKSCGIHRAVVEDWVKSALERIDQAVNVVIRATAETA